MHIRQPEIPAGVAVGEPLVIKSEAVEHCRVEVVDGRAVLHGLEPELVRRAVDGAAPDAAACEPHAERPNTLAV